jgi:hypothetical protein
VLLPFPKGTRERQVFIDIAGARKSQVCLPRLPAHRAIPTIEVATEVVIVGVLFPGAEQNMKSSFGFAESGAGVVSVDPTGESLLAGAATQSVFRSYDARRLWWLHCW